MKHITSPVDFFDGLDLRAHEEQLTLSLQERYTKFKIAEHEAGCSMRLSRADTQALRECISRVTPNVRGVACRMLCTIGLVTWDDLDDWIVRQRRRLREIPLIAIAYGRDAVCDLVESDIEHCAYLFDRVFSDSDRFSGIELGRCMNVCISKSRELLEATWRGTGIMLDLDRPYVTSPVTIGYLEDVIVYRHLLTWNDPLLLSWIEGRSVKRKMALLSMIAWFGMRKPGLEKIAEALAKDANTAVGRSAQSFLEHCQIPGTPD